MPTNYIVAAVVFFVGVGFVFANMFGAFEGQWPWHMRITSNPVTNLFRIERETAYGWTPMQGTLDGGQTRIAVDFLTIEDAQRYMQQIMDEQNGYAAKWKPV